MHSVVRKKKLLGVSVEVHTGFQNHIKSLRFMSKRGTARAMPPTRESTLEFYRS